jgi:hypothetical protein
MTSPISIRISEGLLYSRENRGTQNYNGAGIFSDLLWFTLLITIPPLSHNHLSRPLRCAIALITQHIIISSVFKLGASSLMRHLADCWVRKLFPFELWCFFFFFRFVRPLVSAKRGRAEFMSLYFPPDAVRRTSRFGCFASCIHSDSHHSYTNENEIWQHCVLWNIDLVSACSVRAICTIAVVPPPIANMERPVGLSPGGGEIISASSVTQLSPRLPRCILVKFCFHR